jgi:hypothetical protein
MEPAVRGARTQSGIAAARPKISNYVGLIAIATANEVRIPARASPPGTEFLDAETGRQKSPLKRITVRRDQNLGNGWPKVPAETPYLGYCRKFGVCKGWVVEAPRLEPGTQ